VLCGGQVSVNQSLFTVNDSSAAAVARPTSDADIHGASGVYRQTLRKMDVFGA